MKVFKLLDGGAQFCETLGEPKDEDGEECQVDRRNPDEALVNNLVDGIIFAEQSKGLFDIFVTTKKGKYYVGDAK